MYETATTVLESLGLANKFPEEEHGRVYDLLFYGRYDGPHIYPFMQWITSFLQRQIKSKNLNVDVDTIKTEAAKARWFRGHRTIINLNADPDTLASMLYLEKHLRSNVDAFLLRYEKQNNLAIPDGIQSFTNHTAITEMITRAIRICAIEQSARAFYVLDILTDCGLRPNYALLSMFGSYDPLNDRRQSPKAITRITKKCLQDRIAIETIWNIPLKGGQTIWDLFKKERSMNMKETKAILLAIFAKQKLLFDYLLCLTPTSMEDICNSNPGADTLLLNAGNLPVSRAQKLNIACMWISPFLLDLADVDVSIINSDTPIDNLVMPRQISNLPLNIEI